MPWLLNPREAAERLRISRDAVEALAREGRIPCVVLPGGAIRFHPADLEAWVNSRRCGVRVDAGQEACDGATSGKRWA